MPAQYTLATRQTYIKSLYPSLALSKEQAVEISNITQEYREINKLIKFCKSESGLQVYLPELQVLQEYIENLLNAKKCAVHQEKHKTLQEKISHYNSIGGPLCVGLATYPLMRWMAGFCCKGLQIACGAITLISFYKLLTLNSEMTRLRHEEWQIEHSMSKYFSRVLNENPIKMEKYNKFEEKHAEVLKNINHYSDFSSLLCVGLGAYPLMRWMAGFSFKGLQIMCGVITVASFFKWIAVSFEVKRLHAERLEIENKKIEYRTSLLSDSEELNKRKADFFYNRKNNILEKQIRAIAV